MSFDFIIGKILGNDILMIIAIGLAGFIGYKIVSKLLKLITLILSILYMVVKIKLLI